MVASCNSINYTYRCNINTERVTEFLRVECERSSQEYVQELLRLHRTTLPKILSGDYPVTPDIVSRIVETYHLPLSVFQLFTEKEALMLACCYFRKNHRIYQFSELPRNLYYILKFFDLSKMTKRIAEMLGYNIICADQTFTDRELLSYLKNSFYKTGSIPKVSEHPLAPTIIQRFNSRSIPPEFVKKITRLDPRQTRLGAWNKALLMAGIPVTRILRTEESRSE